MNRELLEQPFSSEAIRHRDGSFGNVLYVEGHTVIQRLNDALDASWSFEVMEHRVFKELDEVLVLGKLSTHNLAKSQFGSSTIKRSRQTSEIICIADAFKAAATDSLKKCATLLGVGLDLYAGNERADASFPENNDHTWQKQASRPDRTNGNGNGRLTAKQRQYLLNLANGQGVTQQQLMDHCLQAYGAGLDYIKRKEASDLIEAFRSGQLQLGPPPSSADYLN